MNLSEIRTTLNEIGVSPMKSLGQNFLHDKNLVRSIVAEAELTPEDYVVEIGPGLGALTRVILEQGARVLAIEKDARLAKFLRARFKNKNLEVTHQDALEFDVRTLFGHARVKLLGNLPYYISSQLLLTFLHYPSPICFALLMLQKELAVRLSAEPGNKDYGALTLQVQRHYRVKLLRRIPASVFFPQPEVDSAIVRFIPRSPEELPAYDDALFREVVRLGFSQRRKQLGKLVRDIVSDWPRAAEALGVAPQARAEELSLLQWIALANFVRPIVRPSPATAAAESFPVVDENDRVLGAAPRAKVHGDNLRHRAVHILIFNQTGEILLQKRSRWKDRHPGAWDSSVAGHVDAGEEYDATAARELKEELGIAMALKRVVKIPASERTGQEFVWLYQGEHEGGFKPDPAEIETIEFFPQAVVDRWLDARPEDFAPGFAECWQAYRKDREA